MSFTRNIGSILLAVYLFLIGLSALVPAITLPAVVLPILAIVASIFLFLGK